MSDVLISIVVPVYKVPYKLLERCLASINAQTSDNYEAILVDDGSPDDCGKICDAFAKQHERFRVIHQDNGGLSVVRNKGIDSAIGQWVCFVDGDDWIEPNTVAFAEQYVKDCPDGDVLIWDEYYDVGTASKRNRFVKDAQAGINCYKGEDKHKLLDMFFPKVYEPFDDNYVDIGTANARLYRRDFLREKRVYNKPGLKRMQDNVFNLWVFDKADKIYYQCERLYHYSFNEEAATQKYAPNNVDTMYFLYSCMEEFVRSTQNPDAYYPRLYTRFMRIFGELFKLNFANPDNPKSWRERIRDVNEAFSREKFKNVIENFDESGQQRRLCFIHRRLMKKQYGLLLVYFSTSIKTRKLRLMLRQK